MSVTACCYMHACSTPLWHDCQGGKKVKCFLLCIIMVSSCQQQWRVVLLVLELVQCLVRSQHSSGDSIGIAPAL